MWHGLARLSLSPMPIYELLRHHHPREVSSLRPLLRRQQSIKKSPAARAVSLDMRAAKSTRTNLVFLNLTCHGSVSGILILREQEGYSWLK
jgi:hypothetical protein